MDVNHVDQVRIAHIIEDHAGRYFGLVGSDTYSESDCARYLTEGPLKRLCEDRGWNWRTLWTLVAKHLKEHPQVMGVRYTDAQIADRKAARNAAAKALIAEAEAPFAEERFADVLTLIDQAELTSPDFDQFEIYRDIVAQRAAGVEPLVGR